MTEIENILADISHRPFEIPEGTWQYYQEWNNAVFLHWKVPFDILRKCVPKKLNLDSINGDYYISLVAFTMQKIRPKKLPPLRFISDFHEINIRTYIDNNGRKGVYFLNIESEKYLSTYLAKSLSGLPYEKALISRREGSYVSKNVNKNFKLDIKFEIGEVISQKSELDLWLTERYCLYLDKDDQLYRYEIHHKEWEIKSLSLLGCKIMYRIGDVTLNDQPDLMHYSEGVKVLAWRKQLV